MSNDQSARPDGTSLRELWRLAWPFILSNSCWTMQIVLDRVLLSRHSTEAVGAGMSAVMLFWSGLSLFQWTANYATTFVAQYTGANQPLRVGAVIGQSLWFSVAAGLAFFLMVPLAGPLMALTQHAAELQTLEVIYFQCLCCSALPFLVTATASSFFAGRGQSSVVLLINLLGLVVNAICAIVLIYGLLGFPEMGIAGAGWATVIGTSTSALVGLGLLLLPKYIREFGNLRLWGFDRALFGRLMYYGLPQGVGAALETLAFSAFIILVGLFGKADLAATGITSTLNLLAILPMMGVGQAIEVLVGQHLGANQPWKAERAAWTGLLLALGATLVVFAGYVFAPHWLMLPFQTQSDPEGWAEVASRVPPLLRFVAIYCLFDCINMTFAFALRGAGDTLFVTVVALLISWPVMVLPTWLACYHGWGLYWAWSFASAYVILLALIYLGRFLQGKWKQMRVIEQPGGGGLAHGGV